MTRTAAPEKSVPPQQPSLDEHHAGQSGAQPAPPGHPGEAGSKEPVVLPPATAVVPYGGKIAEYSVTAQKLAEVKGRLSNIVYDFTKVGELQRALKDRAEVRGYRLNLEKLRKEIKAPALERCDMIDDEARSLRLDLESIEFPIDASIKAEETRKEREKEEAEQRERDRIDTIQRKIQELAGLPTAVAGRTSAEITEQLKVARAFDLAFATEYKEAARAAQERAVAALEQLLAGAEAQEKRAREDAELRKREQEELERLRRDKAERDAAEEKANREKQAKIIEEAKARAAQEAAEKARRDEETRAHRERLDAEERAAREKREAEEKASRERIQREEEATRAKLRAEQEVRDREEAESREQRRVQEERIATESKRVAEERRELDRKAAELADGTALLRTFVDKYGEREEFAAIAKTIKQFLDGVKAKK